jgi:hypothetical protein
MLLFVAISSSNEPLFLYPNVFLQSPPAKRWKGRRACGPSPGVLFDHAGSGTGGAHRRPQWSCRQQPSRAFMLHMVLPVLPPVKADIQLGEVSKFYCMVFHGFLWYFKYGILWDKLIYPLYSIKYRS